MIWVIHHSLLLSSNNSLWHATYCWSTNHEYTLYTSCYVKGGLPLTAHRDPRDYSALIADEYNRNGMHQLTFIVKGWTTFNLAFGSKGLFWPCHISYSSLLAYFNVSFRFLNNSATCSNRCIWWTYIIGSCCILLVNIRRWRGCWFAYHIHCLHVCNMNQMSTIPSVNSTITCLDIVAAPTDLFSDCCFRFPRSVGIELNRRIGRYRF